MNDRPNNPNGTPVLSATSVHLWLVAGVTLAAGFTAAGQMLPEEYRLARTTCSVLGIALGAGIGIASPGLRKAGAALALLLCVGLISTGCATHYATTDTGPSAFSFTLTPEQCAQLDKEKRTYHATQQTASYVSGAGAVLTGVFLGLLDAKTAPAVSAGATLAASGVSVFSGSQVSDLDAELQQGGCR